MLVSRQRFLLILLSAVFLAGCTPPAPSITSTPSPVPVQGSAGIGDVYYPNLGNSGYDVQHYTITLNVDPPANAVEGSTTITAIPSEYLSSFNLDFHGLTVDSVTVNDSAAKFSRNEEELTIEPPAPLGVGQPFTTVVQYHGSPEMIMIQGGPFQMGWSHAESGAINVWGEPDAASTWFPNNNHPRDKATFRFEITVAHPWMVAATGTLKETKENGDTNTFVWEMDKPMATYLASINIDQYDLVTQSGPNGMTIRNYFTVDLPSSQRIQFNILPAAIDFFDDLFGPYPFEEYGVVIAHGDGFCQTTETALETQSMSLHCPTPFMTSEWVIVHELAHQWFGDSVSLENWKDIWLKEGMATYAEWLWDAKGDPAAMQRVIKSQKLSYFDVPSPVAEPDANNLYTGDSYTGGAFVFHALRMEVGDEAFFEILRAYTERYRDRHAGTDEFIALTEEVSGKDLQSFFDAWLFSDKLPKIPD
ncbi:MAG TPA: M1 family metallopeptidase [Anaerolineales bacterium]|nr:M1 family metallopeptidase [Anaerolineales bacterium]